MAHRDVKLENFVVRDNGTLCLVDFGVATLHSRHGVALPSAIESDATAVAVGSTLYCAPELSAKKSKLGTKSNSGGHRRGDDAAKLADYSDRCVRAFVMCAHPHTHSLFHFKLVSRSERAFAADLWAVGVVLLELASGHVFQMRRDRLVLGTFGEREKTYFSVL